MTCRTTGLSAISYANGFTLWHYRTKDPAIDVATPGYFNEAARMVRQGDFIFVNADWCDGIGVVVKNEGGHVLVDIHFRDHGAAL